MYSALKNNETVKLFMPDYSNGQLPDKEFFIKLIWSIFLEQMFDLIMKAHKNREIVTNDTEDNTFEVDPEIEFMIQQPNTNFIFIKFYFNQTEEDIHFLKKKTKLESKMKPFKKI